MAVTDLSKHAIGVLRDAAANPIPTQEINPGVVHTLIRRGLAQLVDHPSPKHKGRPIPHLVTAIPGLELLDSL
jgi:hypothetical protein